MLRHFIHHLQCRFQILLTNKITHKIYTPFVIMKYIYICIGYILIYNLQIVTHTHTHTYVNIETEVKMKIT